MRRLLTLACLAVACTTAQDSPEFRSGTRLVQVDVIVHEKDKFVAGLTKDKFELFDDGKPQNIATFAAPPQGERATDENAPSGATAILVDHMNTRIEYQPYVHSQLAEFTRSREAKDRLAIYVLTDASLRLVHDFTDPSENLAKEVASIEPDRLTRPRPASRTDTYQTARELMVATTTAMNEIAQHMAKIPGRKNLVWISGSFPVFANNNFAQFDFSNEIARSLRVVSDANVAVYPVDARGLVTESDQRRLCAQYGTCGGVTEPPNLNTMNLIADQTGGRAYYNSNGIADSVERAIDDGGQVYTLGFYPAETAMDDTFHKLRVNVGVPGAEVRFRPGYFASKNTP